MRRARLLLFVVFAVVGVGCGASVDRQATSPLTSTAPLTTDRRDTFSMRLVLASAAPPCESASATVLPQTQAGTVISCLTVGEATVTGHDVESVAMSSDNATSVNITFTADGAQRLDDLFARHYGDQVAMVWHSGVIAAVNIDLPSVNGHVSIGDMNLADAQRLVGELGGDPSDVPVPTPDDVESERLFKICQQHVPPGTGPAGVLFTSSLTAGEITELAQAMLGHSIPPWDALPADHLVARCSFGFESLPPNAPTTVCANGDVMDLASPKQYLGDEEGHWTDDPLSDVDRCP